MTLRSANFVLTTTSDTSQLAQRLSAFLQARDVILLRGEIGAGKTFFARALILRLLAQPEDIPSPTFTLVQTYDTHIGEIWHADLYRLHDPSEIIELGLIQAFEQACCLVEWPEQLGDMTPENALTLSFAMGDQEEMRTLATSWQNPRWDSVIEALQNE